MTISTIGSQFAAPFPPELVDWKPQTIHNQRALAVAYIDARAVMDRLDHVVGPSGWQDSYQVLPDGCVVCTLEVLIGEQWVSKSDVGGPSDQRPTGDRLKAAFSDALKRVAVKYGIGRYLYSVPPVWVDYDPQRRQLKATPRLPAWALPPADPKARPAASPAAQAIADAARAHQVPSKELMAFLGVERLSQLHCDRAALALVILQRRVPFRDFLSAWKVNTLTDLPLQQCAQAAVQLQAVPAKRGA